MNPDAAWALNLYSMFGRGGDDERIVYLTVPGEPWSKARPRFTRRGHTYQPPEDQEAERALAWRMRARRHDMFPGNVMMVCRFYRGNSQRIDTDNLLKHVCDSANGIWWADDSQVTLLLGEIHHDPAAPRTVILVGNHASTLRRGTDREILCVYCGKAFLPHIPTQRFCSQQCSHAARATRLEPRPCAECGQVFQPATKAQKLCSQKCRADRLRGVHKARAKPRSQCTSCGRELAHTRGGRCRDCWRADPGFYPKGA